ncbi:hypothetical protein PCO87_18490 [Pectobacteriaceae bacterium C52]|nr:hypothetical protein PCO87_18490 [Pectobacteriaceae bacterium C52]
MSGGIYRALRINMGDDLSKISPFLMVTRLDLPYICAIRRIAVT